MQRYGKPARGAASRRVVSTDPPRHQQCSLCLELYKSPRILPCFHTYCLACLEQLVAHTPGASSFNCPDCRTVVQVPAGGVGKFQVNFYVEAAMENLQLGQRSTAHICDMCGSQNATTKCVDCDQFACNNCTAVHARIGATRSHTVLSLNAQQQASPMVSKERYCTTHKDERIRFFCNQCSSVLCPDCKLTSHEGHPTVELAQKSKDAKKMLLQVVKKAGILLPKLNQSLKKAVAHKTDVARNKTELLSTLQKNADKIKRAVDRCLKEAEGNLRSQSTSLEKEMAQTIEDMQQQIACLKSLFQYVRQVVTTGCDADILSLPEQMATFFGCDLSVFTSHDAYSYQSLPQQAGRRAEQQRYYSWPGEQDTVYEQEVNVPFGVFTNESWYSSVVLTEEPQKVNERYYSSGGQLRDDLMDKIFSTIGETSVTDANDGLVNELVQYGACGWSQYGKTPQKTIKSQKSLPNKLQSEPEAISENIGEIQSVIGQWYDLNRFQSQPYGKGPTDYSS